MYRNLARQVSTLPNIASFDMVELDCDDLKRGLASKSHSFAEYLLTRLATDHRNENIRYAAKSFFQGFLLGPFFCRED